MKFDIAFAFLTKLGRNNNREWFEKNKPQFLAIKSDFENFIGELHEEAIHIEPALSGLDPKKLVFRIYRDVRFSKDKKPYKKFLSAGLSEGGKGTGKPGYYLQLEPGNKSFICTGLYSPDPETLGKIRQEIDYNGELLVKFFLDKKVKTLYGPFWDSDTLKNIPKGFDKDHPHAQWLKLKSFVLMHTFKDAEVMDKKFFKKLLECMETGKPLNDFLKQAGD